MVDDPQFRLSQMFQEVPDSSRRLGFTDPSQNPVDQTQQGIGGAIQSLGNYFQYTKDQQVIQDAAKHVAVKYDSSKPVTTFEVPNDLVPYYQQAVKGWGQIQENYQRMLMENQARQNSGKPWANALATIAGSLAANDPNPITRGLGQAAQQLNPTRAQLQAQQMQLLQGQAQVAGQGLQAAEGMYRINSQGTKMAQDMEMERQKLGLEERRVKLAEDSTGQKAEVAKLDDERAFNTKWDDRASKRLFDPKAFVSEYKKLFPQATQAQIDEQLQGKQSLQKAATALAREVGSEKVGEFRQRQQVTLDFFKKKNDITHRQDMEKVQARIKSTNPKMTSKQIQNLSDLEEAEILTKNMREAMKTHPNMFGPLLLSPEAAARRFIDPMFDSAASEVTATYAHATPIMVKLLGEGARGYAQNQREWVESKVPRLTDTLERTEGKIRFMEGLLEARRRGEDKAYVEQMMRAEKGGKGVADAKPSATAEPQVIDGFTITVK